MSIDVFCCCCSPDDVSDDEGRSLFALVLTPTRELAFQIRDHLRSVAKDTGIKVSRVLGFHLIIFKRSFSVFVSKPLINFSLSILATATAFPSAVSSVMNFLFKKIILARLLQCHVVVGGMSIQRQSRILDKDRPEIVVATPGRLWDIYKQVVI